MSRRTLDFHWNLRRLMAAHDMWKTTELVPLLRERGVDLSASQVYRLVTDKPERLSMKVLIALCDILGCTPPTSSTPTWSRRAAERPRASLLPRWWSSSPACGRNGPASSTRSKGRRAAVAPPPARSCPVPAVWALWPVLPRRCRYLAGGAGL
jgi:DNA-binding Xre family transcriptional regulator